jgi:pyruvate-formate lyase
VTSTAEEYRANARECEEHAAQMPVKEKLLEIAKKWRAMAAFEETHGR